MKEKTAIKKRNVYATIIESLCIIGLVGLCIYLALNWNSFPSRIPGHYDASGNVTRWTSKSVLLVLPIIAWAFYIGLSLVEAFPAIWNTGVKVTEENRERIYRIIKNMICTLKFVFVITFITLSLMQATATKLPSYFTWLEMVFIFGVLIYFVVKLAKNK